MSAAHHDLTIDQGTFWSQRLLWKDTNDQPVPLTDYTARMQIREQVNFDNILIELTTENGRITIEPGGDTGYILLQLTSDETSALDATVYDRDFVYDLELVPPNNEVTRLIQGSVYVSLEVTR